MDVAGSHRPDGLAQNLLDGLGHQPTPQPPILTAAGP